MHRRVSQKSYAIIKQSCLPGQPAGVSAAGHGMGGQKFTPASFRHPSLPSFSLALALRQSIFRQSISRRQPWQCSLAAHCYFLPSFAEYYAPHRHLQSGRALMFLSFFRQRGISRNVQASPTDHLLMSSWR